MRFGSSYKFPGAARTRAMLVGAILLGSACALSLFAAAAPAQDLPAQLAFVQRKQSAVGAALASDNRQVNDLIGQVSALRQSEAALQNQLNLKQAELDRA